MSIHIERNGGPPDLPTAFAHFVVHHLRGRSLDDNKDEEAKLGKLPDFACSRDLVLIEMKHLEADHNERINEAYPRRDCLCQCGSPGGLRTRRSAGAPLRAAKLESAILKRDSNSAPEEVALLPLPVRHPAPGWRPPQRLSGIPFR